MWVTIKPLKKSTQSWPSLLTPPSCSPQWSPSVVTPPASTLLLKPETSALLGSSFPHTPQSQYFHQLLTAPSPKYFQNLLTLFHFHSHYLSPIKYYLFSGQLSGFLAFLCLSFSPPIQLQQNNHRDLWNVWTSLCTPLLKTLVSYHTKNTIWIFSTACISIPVWSGCS